MKISDLKILNNCDEFIDFMNNEFMNYPLDIIVFQGDILRVCRTGIQYPESTVDSIFVSEREVDGFFYLQLAREDRLNMMTPTIMVPNYVKEELIATLKGEW